MKIEGKKIVSRRVVMFEGLAFGATILLIWFDELYDIPYHLLGGQKTPVNWQESLFESAAILLLAIIAIRNTYGIFQKMKYLEGILPVCASCKKIRDDKEGWQQIEEYIRDRSAADFSHGICPDCARKLYPELFDENNLQV